MITLFVGDSRYDLKFRKTKQLIWLIVNMRQSGLFLSHVGQQLDCMLLTLFLIFCTRLAKFNGLYGLLVMSDCVGE